MDLPQSQKITQLEYSRLEQLQFLPSQHDSRYRYTEDLKDPCVVKAHDRWHVYGSIGSSRLEQWEIFHAVANQYDGPWLVQPPVVFESFEHLLGDRTREHVAAPAVVVDGEGEGTRFHMAIQTDFLQPGGKILYLESADGQTFKNPKIILDSLDYSGSLERGIYDPHFAVARGRKFMSYSGAELIGFQGERYVADPDIFLAESVSGKWDGPWERKGKILTHDDVPHHNNRQQQDYEWGLEGSQLVELSNEFVLLVAVCFKPNEAQGLRQRIFFAVAHEPTGPYKTLGIAIEPSPVRMWNTGENGHAMVDIYSTLSGQQFLRVWHQGRPRPGAEYFWSHRYADFPLEHILELCRRVLWVYP